MAGHGNWVEFYESSGFHKSIDTARRWMQIALMTDAEIAEVSSVREAVALLKEAKRQKKGAGDSGLKMDEDKEPGPEPEPLDLLETAVVKVCRKYSRGEVKGHSQVC